MTRALTLVASALACACGTRPEPPSTTRPEPPTTARPEPPGGGNRTTVPLHVEGNRPFVEVTFRKPDGSTHAARFLVDSGGGGFLIVEPLARDLGLAMGETMREEGQTFAKVTSPVQASVGSLPLELDPERVLVLVGKDNFLPPAAPGRADGMLPGHVLARYHVVLE